MAAVMTSTPDLSPVPLTVIGGYLGAGKTTLLNALLREPDGRRLGVVVNDFGVLSIDVDRLRGVDGAGLVSLPNGCVCCTLGADLQGALQSLLAAEPRPDHVVVEVSGVADPATAAAWGTVPPFEPGGVVVLADAEAVTRHARDRYVGGEVVRQFEGADLIVVTKSDVVGADRLAGTGEWLERTAPGVPRLLAVHGDVAADLVLGLRPDAVVPVGADPRPAVHDDRYISWSWSTNLPSTRTGLERFVDALPPTVLRMKGTVYLDDGASVDVDVVGPRREIRRSASSAPRGVDRRASRLVAIALRGALDLPALDELAASSL
jgi:G3E family GTPase